MSRCAHCFTPDVDLRLGVCFRCADEGELRAARRTVAMHLVKALSNALAGNWTYVRFDLRWAWQRLTGTGDYAPGGYFDQEHPGWRRLV